MVGTLDVDEMLESMPEGLFNEWCEFDRIEPLGPQKVCDVIAQCASLIALKMELKGDDGKPLGPDDFMHWVEKQKHKQQYVSPEQSARTWRQSVGTR